MLINDWRESSSADRGSCPWLGGRATAHATLLVRKRVLSGVSCQPAGISIWAVFFKRAVMLFKGEDPCDIVLYNNKLRTDIIYIQFGFQLL